MTPTPVQALIGHFLEWTKQNRAEGTYGWYSWRLGSFGKYVGSKLTIDKLKPFHVTRWIEQEYNSVKHVADPWIAASHRNDNRDLPLALNPSQRLVPLP